MDVCKSAFLMFLCMCVSDCGYQSVVEVVVIVVRGSFEGFSKLFRKSSVSKSFVFISVLFFHDSFFYF